MAKVDALIADGRFAADTSVHHFALRDRRVRPNWRGPLPVGQTRDGRISDWLDWLTGQIPGAVVIADSPADFPFVAGMSNPLIARVAAISTNHLADRAAVGDPTGELVPLFADRFVPVADRFEAIVVATNSQLKDLKALLAPDAPLRVIPEMVPHIPQESPSPVVLPRRVVTLGALDFHTHAPAIQAIQALSGRYPDLRLEIVGEGPHGAELLALAVELGVANRVHLLAGGTADPFRGARLGVCNSPNDSATKVLITALSAGVPVVARDLRYGPRDLIAKPRVGAIVGIGEPLAPLMDEILFADPSPQSVVAAAAEVLHEREPAVVARRWTELASELSESACDRRIPALLVESIYSTARVIKVSGVLADSATALTEWTCQLAHLETPAGWLSAPPVLTASDAEDNDEPPSHPHAAGPTREVVVQLRSNALAYSAVKSGEAHRLDFGDGTTTRPLLAAAFPDRFIASQVGNATLSRRTDGSVWVTPREELVFTSEVDGRLIVRNGEGEPPSDVTHAVTWKLTLAWEGVTLTPEEVGFTGLLTGSGLAPDASSIPSVCVSDVGGFARTVGAVEYATEPVVDGLSWQAHVTGQLSTTALGATVKLAGRPLRLFVGFPSILEPIGSVWTSGSGKPMRLATSRGQVTLIPSSEGRVLAAPGMGLRPRISVAIRTAIAKA